jgi:hypothetical protein
MSNLPKTFMGFSIQYERADPDKRKYSPNPSQFPEFPFLTYGSPLGFAEGEWCSLGCFVSFRDGDLGFLTTSHLRQRGAVLKIGDSLFSTTKMFSGDAKPVGVVTGIASLTESTPERRMINRIDVSISRIMAETQYQPAFPDSFPVEKLAEYSEEPRVGDIVFKIGATTGLTYGEITKTEALVCLRPHGNETWMTGAFEVEGTDGSVFSNSGDSGAVIFKRNEFGDAVAIGMITGAYMMTTVAFPLEPALRYFDCQIFTGLR